ncbi:MAG: S-layer homology domain-containing protein [Candidatus Absconditabacterales bacterium]
MSTIDNADMYGSLTRVAMAKMMANYAIEVLGKTPNTSIDCNFPDISIALDSQYDNGVTNACQLGLMGVGIDSFNPNGIVTRAQFGTVLSRALYDDVYNVDTNPYYAEHLAALNQAGIMTMISNPDQLEIRGYVMLMMQRADELINTGDVTAPTATVVYSTTGSTTGNVIATLTGRSETITGVNAYSHTFTGNGSFVFTFSDLAGNAGNRTATVNNITGNIVTGDSIHPTATVSYSTTGATSGDVIVTLTGRSETITGVNAYTHTFTGNGSFIFTFSDLAGNTGSATATVSNIDKTAPTAGTTLSPDQGTYISGDILATLTGRSETLTGVNAYNYTFTGNGSFIFTFSDLVGNTGSRTVTVSYWTGN